MTYPRSRRTPGTRRDGGTSRPQEHPQPPPSALLSHSTRALTSPRPTARDAARRGPRTKGPLPGTGEAGRDAGVPSALRLAAARPFPRLPTRRPAPPPPLPAFLPSLLPSLTRRRRSRGRRVSALGPRCAGSRGPDRRRRAAVPAPPHPPTAPRLRRFA